MVGWHHQLNGHEFEQTLGDREGQGSLACCSPWGHKAQDTTQQLKTKTITNYLITILMLFALYVDLYVLFGATTNVTKFHISGSQCASKKFT